MKHENKEEFKMENIPSEQSMFDYVEDPNPVVKKSKPVYGEVNCSELNLRAEPSKDADIIAILRQKDIVTIIENDRSSVFYKVFINGKSGYCVKEYITKK